MGAPPRGDSAQGVLQGTQPAALGLTHGVWGEGALTVTGFSYAPHPQCLSLHPLPMALWLLSFSSRAQLWCWLHDLRVNTGSQVAGVARRRQDHSVCWPF